MVLYFKGSRIIQKTLSGFFVLLSIVGCSSKSNDDFSLNHYENLLFVGENPELTILNIEIEKVVFQEDTIPFGIGFFSLVGEKLLYFDRLRGNVYSIDPLRGHVELFLKNGEAPNESPKIQTFASNGKRHFFFQGYTYWIFNESWETVSKNNYEFYNTEDLDEIQSTPSTDMIGIYEVKYWENQPIIFDNHIWINIESTNPSLNLVMHEEYYKSGRLVAEVNIKSGQIERILGRKSPQYQNYAYLPHYDYHYISRYGDSFLINFEIDSLIYVADENLIPKAYFGAQGRNMDISYRQVNTVDDWGSYWYFARVKKGFYKHIYSDSERNLIFRSYHLGNKNDVFENIGDNPKRLQIYKNFTLVGDVEVPKFFKIIGKIGGYYYADGSVENPDNEEIVLYRFKLPEL